jgi:hypothetical protein
MAAFFICRDFNVRTGLVCHRNDMAKIIPRGNKLDEACQDNLNDIGQANDETERLLPGAARLIR